MTNHRAARAAEAAGASPARRGFVLLYAVMTSTIILAVGVSIISIALKQLSISTLGRESQYAFYAANTGAECALYWDFHGVLQPIEGAPGGAAYRRLTVFSNPFLDLAEWPEVAEEDLRASVRCARTNLMKYDELIADGCNGSNPDGPNDSWCEGPCTELDGVSWTDDECRETRFTVFLGRFEDGDVDHEGPCARVTVMKARGVTGPSGEFSVDPGGPNLQTTIDARGYNYCDPDNARRVERGLRFTY